LLDVFAQDYAALLEEIEQAMRESDEARLIEVVRSLGSALSSLGFEPARSRCESIADGSGDWKARAKAVAALQKEVERALSAARRMARERAQPYESPSLAKQVKRAA